MCGPGDKLGEFDLRRRSPIRWEAHLPRAFYGSQYIRRVSGSRSRREREQRDCQRFDNTAADLQFQDSCTHNGLLSFKTRLKLYAEHQDITKSSAAAAESG